MSNKRVVDEVQFEGRLQKDALLSRNKTILSIFIRWTDGGESVIPSDKAFHVELPNQDKQFVALYESKDGKKFVGPLTVNDASKVIPLGGIQNYKFLDVSSHNRLTYKWNDVATLNSNGQRVQVFDENGKEIFIAMSGDTIGYLRDAKFCYRDRMNPCVEKIMDSNDYVVLVYIKNVN